MKTPESLEPLIDYGIIQEVLRPLMSGKEAQVYVVLAEGEERVAKVYKEACQRSFKHRSAYTEGRGTRNSRDRRAVAKRTRHGRLQDEAAWRTAEVDMIYRLRDAGVRVPEPINFVEGVLVMELVKDAQGRPAPRLGDLSFGAAEATEIYQHLLREVVRMLCAGAVHGDLSDFNVLMAADGPVVIDFPQAVDPTRNPNARELLLRDVENLHRFVEAYVPEHRRRPYAQEMWSLYESNRLTPETELGGDYRPPQGVVDTDEVMALIGDARLEARGRRHEHKGAESEDSEAPIALIKPMRTVVDFTKEGKQGPSFRSRGAGRGGGRERRSEPERPRARVERGAGAVEAETRPAGPGRRRRRRRSDRKPATHAGSDRPASTSRRESGRRDDEAGSSSVGSGGVGAQGVARPSRRRRRRSRRSGSAIKSKPDPPVAGERP
jgi:RIO kinase 1